MGNIPRRAGNMSACGDLLAIARWTVGEKTSNARRHHICGSLVGPVGSLHLRHRRKRLPVAIAAAIAMWGVFVVAGAGQGPLAPSVMRNHPAIRYQQSPPNDAVAALNERLRGGEVRLRFDPTSGYLRSILEALRVPEDSQLLVFSKTSFQARRIGPANPRALFFNDTVSVGWVRGGDVLEFIAQDPRQGAMFYTLEQTPSEAPQIRRDLTCVQCHTWEATAYVPGMFLGSGYTDPNGSLLYAQVYSSDHRTPYQLRWGGWYVTGRHSFPRHMGNATVTPGAELADMVTPASVNTTSLEGRFDMAGYPTPQSDVVALMVLEHQARMLNLITRVGWEARIGAEAGAALRQSVDELVDYLLFVDEEPLPGPVAGVSAFTEVFTRAGVKDSKGRSLRDLDLTRRLMRYPCSYLIYSPSFDALPDNAKQSIYARMWTILSGGATEARYAQLSAADRQAVLDILRETKPGLPSYFDAKTSG